MNQLQMYIRNNYRISPDWNLNKEQISDIVLNKLKSVKAIDWDFDIEVFKFLRKDCLKYDRMKQVLNDIESTILPIMLNNNIGELYKIKGYDNIFILDDMYSRVFFEHNSKKITVYEITAGILTNPIRDN